MLVPFGQKELDNGAAHNVTSVAKAGLHAVGDVNHIVKTDGFEPLDRRVHLFIAIEWLDRGKASAGILAAASARVFSHEFCAVAPQKLDQFSGGQGRDHRALKPQTHQLRDAARVVHMSMSQQADVH